MKQETTKPYVQPSLPGFPEVSARFRIPEHTRSIGLAAVAGVKAQLAEQAARREAREAAQTSHRTSSTSPRRATAISHRRAA